MSVFYPSWNLRRKCLPDYKSAEVSCSGVVPPTEKAESVPLRPPTVCVYRRKQRWLVPVLILLAMIIAIVGTLIFHQATSLNKMSTTNTSCVIPTYVTGSPTTTVRDQGESAKNNAECVGTITTSDPAWTQAEKIENLGLNYIVAVTFNKKDAIRITQTALANEVNTLGSKDPMYLFRLSVALQRYHNVHQKSPVIELFDGGRSKLITNTEAVAVRIGDAMFQNTGDCIAAANAGCLVPCGVDLTVAAMAYDSTAWIRPTDVLFDQSHNRYVVKGCTGVSRAPSVDYNVSITLTVNSGLTGGEYQLNFAQLNSDQPSCYQFRSIEKSSLPEYVWPIVTTQPCVSLSRKSTSTQSQRPLALARALVSLQQFGVKLTPNCLRLAIIEMILGRFVFETRIV